MKKIFGVILTVFLCAAMLVGCGENSGSDQSGGSAAEVGQTASSADSAQTPKNYLKTDSTQAEAYNAAINAYNAFLSGEINAVDKTTNKAFNINDMDALNSSGINSFALFDVNGNGIPELHTRSDFYDVFSYQDGQLVRWYTSGVNLTDGNVIPLDNGAVFAALETTGTSYEYTTFGPDGTATTITFFKPDDSSKEYPYYFNGKEVSKEDYDNLTKKYMALSKKPASIQWQNYA